jgi:hypothetical protein
MATVIVVAAAMLGVDAANLRKQDNPSPGCESIHIRVAF